MGLFGATEVKAETGVIPDGVTPELVEENGVTFLVCPPSAARELQALCTAMAPRPSSAPARVVQDEAMTLVISSHINNPASTPTPAPETTDCFPCLFTVFIMDRFKTASDIFPDFILISPFF